MKVLFLCLVFLLPVAGNAGPEPSARMQAAQQAYDTRDYSRALEHYDGLLRDGWSSLALHYNRGNTLARLGRTGAAIASYRAALLMHPRDADAAANLAFVMKEAGLPVHRPSLLDRTLGELSAREWNILLIASWWVSALLAGFTMLVPAGRRWARPPLICCGGLLAVSLAGTIYWRVNQNNPDVVLLRDEAVRFAPLASSTPHFQAPEGDTVTLVSQTGEWLRVTSGRKEGWVPAEACAIVKLASPPAL